MTCPVCSTKLVPETYGDQTIDICPECKGIWFDDGELKTTASQMIQDGKIEDQDIKDPFRYCRSALFIFVDLLSDSRWECNSYSIENSIPNYISCLYMVFGFNRGV